MSSTDRGSEYLWTLWTCEPKSEGMRDPLGGDPKNAKGPKALSLTQYGVRSIYGDKRACLHK